MTIDLRKLDAIAKRIPSGVTIPSEAHFLFDHVIKRAKHGVIEIGSWKGRSTVYLATAAKHKQIPMYAVDSWRDLSDSLDPTENYRDEWPEFCANIEKAGLSYHVAGQFDDNSTAWIGGLGWSDIETLIFKSKPGLKFLKERILRNTYSDDPEFKFDLLFIDADHSEDAVRWDFENWSKILTRPATVILHDVGAFPGPRKLFQYLVQTGKYDYKFLNNMAAIYLE